MRTTIEDCRPSFHPKGRFFSFSRGGEGALSLPKLKSRVGVQESMALTHPSRRAPRGRLSLLVALSLGALACAGAPETGGEGSALDEPMRACPSIARLPRFEMRLEPPLSRNERFDVRLTIDGVEQSCTFEVSGVGPERPMGAAVMSPSTRTHSTCEGLSVTGISGAGSVMGFYVDDTPAQVRVELSQEGEVVALGDYHPTYVPTEVDGAGCGTTQRASETLAFTR